MELKDVFLSLMVVAVGTLAIFSWLGEMNIAYNEDAGSSFNNTIASVSLLKRLNDTAGKVGNNTYPQIGGSPSSQEEGTTISARSTLTLLGDMLGLIPALLQDAAGIVGVPEEYRSAAAYSFMFVFGLTMAYILLLGVRSIFGR